MIDVSGIAVGVTVAAGLLMPFVALRWVPQIVGHFSGPKGKLAALAIGVASLSFIVASFWSEHRTICSNEDQEYQCEISSVLIAAVLCCWALMALTQIRFVWLTISAVRSRKLREV